MGSECNSRSEGYGASLRQLGTPETRKRVVAYIVDIGKEFTRRSAAEAAPIGMTSSHFVAQAMSTLETMLLEGWVDGRVDKTKPMFKYDHLGPGIETNIHENRDAVMHRAGV